MVANLSKKGRKVVAFDLVPASLAAAKAAGASTAGSVVRNPPTPQRQSLHAT